MCIIHFDSKLTRLAILTSLNLKPTTKHAPHVIYIPGSHFCMVPHPAITCRQIQFGKVCLAKRSCTVQRLEALSVND